MVGRPPGTTASAVSPASPLDAELPGAPGNASAAPLVDESQESRDGLHRWMIEHGVGVEIKSPPQLPAASAESPGDNEGNSPRCEPPVNATRADHHSPSDEAHQKSPSASSVTGNASDACRPFPVADAASRQPTAHPNRQRHRNQTSKSRHPQHEQARLGPPPPAWPRSRHEARPRACARAPPRSTMDDHDGHRRTQSQSPTQSNGDRSYDQYQDDTQPFSNHPVTQASDDNPEEEEEEEEEDDDDDNGGDSHAHRTLHDDDTGAVRFEFQDTQLSPDKSVPNDTGVLLPGSPSQDPSSYEDQHPPPPVPETPAALPPFFGAHGNDQLMAASQLFGQTQFTSAVKRLSPTSSRPSPHLFPHNTISPNTGLSSPLKDRGLRTSPMTAAVSSPALARTSSGPTIAPSYTPRKDFREPEYPDTVVAPGFRNVLSRKNPEPISDYKPRSEQIPGSLGPGEGDSESDSDSSALRRQRAKKKQGKADWSLTNVDVARPRSKDDTAVVPSTSRSRQGSSDKRLGSDSGRVQPSQGSNIRNSQAETVTDSQAGQEEPALTEKEAEPEAGPSSRRASYDYEVHPTALDSDQELGEPLRPATAQGSNQLIPETSPAGTAAQPPMSSAIPAPRPVGDIIDRPSSPRSYTAISTPNFPSSVPVQTNRDSAVADASSGDGGEHIAHAAPSARYRAGFRNRNRRTVISSPPVVPDSPQPSPAHQRTAERGLPTLEPSPEREALSGSEGSQSSTLTSFSATPERPSSLSPPTEGQASQADPDRNLNHISTTNSPGETRNPGVELSFPATAKGKRQHKPITYSSASRARGDLRGRSRQPSKDTSRHPSRQSSLSMDELAVSSSPASTRDGRTRPLQSRRPRPATDQGHAKELPESGIFEGMAFAVSFREQQPRETVAQYRQRLERGKKVERLIAQEGGRILDSGFNQLFHFDPLPSVENSSTPVMSSSLRLKSQETGFTALIADGHSRKVKYMQALALGLPCLAPRWVEACVEKRQLMDWTYYLLCAGQSALLDDGIRSRNLHPFDAQRTPLLEMIEKRPKLLEESQILLVMGKAKNAEKRMPYVFLAQVLGASLVRVNDVGEARAKLIEREDSGREFNWVYIDEQSSGTQDALFGTKSGVAPPKKRKRRNPGDEEDFEGRAPKRIRTLNDELVVQSLILGRLIEEGEMDH